MVTFKKPLLLILVFFIPIFLFHSCLTFRMSKKELDNFLAKKTINGSHHSYNLDKQSIHYAIAGDTSKPLVLFVHGSPGSLSAFIDFIADSMLSKHALLATVDRPGFGHSNFGKAEYSLQQQARLLKPIIEKYSTNKPVILVGHSLGGPVIARIAMDYPHLVDGLVLVAASIDPSLEPNEKWFRAPLSTPFLRWILPRSFRASNDEIYRLKNELEDMVPLWDKITCQVIVIQGEKDSLVPARNADFAKNMLVNAPVTLSLHKEANHFIPWNKPELIRQAILELLPKKPAE